ncbi:hypothetical protein T06_4482 [Trichinella sp. T6]|nr:hypothetical protein T06_4482 [Trichinella sp. T6]
MELLDASSTPYGFLDYLVSHRPQWIPWCHIDP